MTADISIPLWFDYKMRGWIDMEEYDEFQFHYGSIIRQSLAFRKLLIKKFQFHYGSIISNRLESKRLGN